MSNHTLLIYNRQAKARFERFHPKKTDFSFIFFFGRSLVSVLLRCSHNEDIQCLFRAINLIEFVWVGVRRTFSSVLTYSLTPFQIYFEIPQFCFLFASADAKFIRQTTNIVSFYLFRFFFGFCFACSSMIGFGISHSRSGIHFAFSKCGSHAQKIIIDEPATK